MSGLKYTLVVALLLLSLAFVSTGCSFFEGESGSDGNTSNVTYELPQIQYGDGGSLVSVIPADFTPVVDAVAPAVVRVVTKTTEYWFFQPIPRTGVGTGIIYDSEGYVLTNRHVVEDAESISVYVSGRADPYNVQWVQEAPDTDLAVLKIAGGGPFPAAEFSPADEIGPYQWVIAIGYPFNIGGTPTVTEGIVSALGRTIQESDGTMLRGVIQTTAAINPGNSGGPLVDLAGRVVGINTAIVEQAENIGFAISVSTIGDFVEGLSAP